MKYFDVDKDDDGQRDEERAHGGVDDVAVLFGQGARRLGGEHRRPVVPADQGRQADQAGHQPHNQDSSKDEAHRPASGVLDRVEKSVIPANKIKSMRVVILRLHWALKYFP